MSSQLTIVTYNVRHAKNIEGDIRLDHIASALRACLARYRSSDLPDDGGVGSSIICLQELDSLSPRSGWIRQGRELAKMLGMRCIYYDSMSAFGLYGFGNAILTNCAVHSTWNKRLPVKIGEPRCVIYACLDIGHPGRGRTQRLRRHRNGTATWLHVFNTHWGLNAAERVKAADLCANLVRKIGHYDPVIFCGDLNAVSNTPEVRRMEESCGLKSTGFDHDLPTYPSHSPKQRIDHILVSNHFVVENVRIVRTMASDHLPLIADVSLIGVTSREELAE
jgi:endonuclease/exonuclease/phosphatase family metal-dependent hydrolase